MPMKFELAGELLKTLGIGEEHLGSIFIKPGFSQLPYPEGEALLRQNLRNYRELRNVEYRGIGEAELNVILKREQNSLVKAANKALRKGPKNEDIIAAASPQLKIALQWSLKSSKSAMLPHEIPYEIQIMRLMVSRSKYIKECAAEELKYKQQVQKAAADREFQAREQRKRNKYKSNLKKLAQTSGNYTMDQFQKNFESEAPPYLDMARQQYLMAHSGYSASDGPQQGSQTLYNGPSSPIRQQLVQSFSTPEGSYFSYFIPNGNANKMMGIQPYNSGVAAALPIPSEDPVGFQFTYAPTVSQMSSQNPDLQSSAISTVPFMASGDIEPYQMHDITLEQLLQAGAAQQDVEVEPQLQGFPQVVQQDADSGLSPQDFTYFLPEDLDGAVLDDPASQSQDIWTLQVPNENQSYQLTDFDHDFSPEALSSATFLKQDFGQPLDNMAVDFMQPMQNIQQPIELEDITFDLDLDLTESVPNIQQPMLNSLGSMQTLQFGTDFSGFAKDYLPESAYLSLGDAQDLGVEDGLYTYPQQSIPTTTYTWIDETPKRG
ncbi:hypothetical protein TWF506_010033 [Arthrobotrys conoides]|uniref:Uncharacterized protein n=1 Tax=Arthrobotrys conoides TaxID=74498 RepID=A0AAN8RWK2_9PEZI